MRFFLIDCIAFLYRTVLKKIFFLRNPESVHNHMTAVGEVLSRIPFMRRGIALLLAQRDPRLKQELFGITFLSPLGLAAGFDYEARLTRILPSLGFGFGSVGTLTHLPSPGNEGPMLGRLPKSRALMVNKGFKNDGVAQSLARLETPLYPIGVSIGKTNTLDITTQEAACADIVAAFRAAEASGVPFAYYELNISCPNLVGTIDFYEPEHLEQLLVSVEALSLSRPVWVKMPISKTDEAIRSIMEVLVRHPFISAVIFGNLQQDRNDPALLPEEVARFDRGNFSGMATQRRSDELIRLAYREYGTRLRVIGCGGVFSAEDAYRKIRLGAHLVQMITGLIFQGPQIVAQINRDIAALLERDGFAVITDAIGVDA